MSETESERQDRFSIDRAPQADVDLQPLQETRFDSMTHFVCSYLQHHFNNKLAIVEGNLAYVHKLVDDLDNIETRDIKSRRRLKELQAGLRESLKPIQDALEKIHSIRKKAEKYIRRIT